jgi:hypothetical protein
MLLSAVPPDWHWFLKLELFAVVKNIFIGTPRGVLFLCIILPIKSKIIKNPDAKPRLRVEIRNEVFKNLGCLKT